MQHGRNNTLDVLKLFASYMVVFIHITFYGEIGSAVCALARFAVPLFFLVSGFYAYKVPPEKIRRRMFRVARLLLFAVAAYTVYNVSRRNTREIGLYWDAYLDLKNLVKLFLFNVPVHTEHLWYLLACLYVYGIFWFAMKIRIPETLMFAAAGLLLLLHLFLEEFLSVWGITVPTMLVRNFALMGLPFFGLGLLVNKYQHIFRKIPPPAIAVLIMIGISETLFSWYYFGNSDLYIGTLCILAALVAVFLKFPDMQYPPAVLSLTGCSTYIYIFHPMLSYVAYKLYLTLDVDVSTVAFHMVHPLVICVLSTVLAYLLRKITQGITNRRLEGKKALAE